MEYCDLTTRLTSLSYLDGFPITADWIIQMVTEKEQGRND